MTEGINLATSLAKALKEAEKYEGADIAQAAQTLKESADGGNREETECWEAIAEEIRRLKRLKKRLGLKK
jgi:hypothetical protein